MEDKHLPEYEMTGRYLAGEASPEEAMQVDDWRRENEAFFDSVNKLWNAEGTYEKPELDYEWDYLEQRMGKQKRRLWSLAYRISAAVVIFAAAIGIYKFLESPREQFESAQANFNVRKLQLPDSSDVTLNAGSVITYRKQFDRSVTLRGEALFAVQHNPAQPFMIDVDSVTIKVIGTSFNVNATDASVQVSVTEGLVMMLTNSDSILIRKDQGGIYDKKTRQLQLLSTIDINGLAYATHIFRFNNMPMSEIKKLLEKVYKVTIIFSNPSIGNCRIKTEFDNESIGHILEVLAKTTGSDLKREGQLVNFIGNGCD